MRTLLNDALRANNNPRVEKELLRMLSLLELIPCSHKRWDSELERNVRLELQVYSNCEELPEAVLIELDPGDVLIFHSHLDSHAQ